MKKSSLLRASVFGALWAAVSLAAILSPGCYGRNCEGNAETFDGDAGGLMIDDRTWVSNPMTSDWLPFPRQRTWLFDIPALGGRTPEIFTAYVSAAPNPTKSGDLTTGSGNLAKFSFPRPDGITLYNDSCSDYWVRVVLQVAPYPPEPAPIDSGTPGAPDAGSDTTTSDAGDGG